MEYMILTDPYAYQLELAVNKKMKEGWQPYGELKALVTGNAAIGINLLFVQAMLKRDENEMWPLR